LRLASFSLNKQSRAVAATMIGALAVILNALQRFGYVLIKIASFDHSSIRGKYEILISRPSFHHEIK